MRDFLGGWADPLTMMGRAQVLQFMMDNWLMQGLLACWLNEVGYDLSCSRGVHHCRLW